MERKDLATKLAYVSAGLLAVGSFLPWVKITAPFVGTLTKSGVEGSDGWATLAAAAVIAWMTFRWTGAGTRKQAVLLIGLAMLTALLLVFEYHDLGQRFSGVDSEYVVSSYGIGLHLCALGVFGSFIAATKRLDVTDDERALAEWQARQGSGALPK